MNYKNLFLLVFILFFSHDVRSQDYLQYASLITPDIIKRDLSVLASDSLEGRGTAEPGMQKAIQFTSSRFESMGLKPAFGISFKQDIMFVKWSAAKFNVTVGGKTLEYGKDYFMTPQANPQKQTIIVSNIIETDLIDTTSLELDSKFALLIRTSSHNHLSNDSINELINSRIKYLSSHSLSVILVERDLKGSREMRQIRRMQSGSISIHEPNPQYSTIVCHIQTGSEFLNFKSAPKGKKTRSFKNNITISTQGELAVCSNVGAYLEGTTKKDELVVISAHLDHLGKRDTVVYYGADDNGSGSAAILNMAAAFSEATRQGKGPQRSLLFLLFTGEEKGLLGSGYYAENPSFPLDKTVVNLNIDMIGRVDTVSRTSNRYVYIIGSDKMSTDLHNTSEKTNQDCCKINLDYTYNDAAHPMRLYYRSDHYSFVKKGIPAIFYFTGLHDDYHKPTDTADKIDFVKTATITQLIFSTAWNLANMEERIRVDKP